MKNSIIKMAGIFCLILCVYPLFIGLYLTEAQMDPLYLTLLTTLGIVLLILGIYLYKIRRTEKPD
ncbi:MAG: hypothetical protein J6D36_04465 [Erysipelotrichaceae bacterium]|nr:hypothetical protein [Erysipelotrichaceae bacterium]